MIHCGRFTTSQIAKILGIFQIICAIIITAVGIGIVIKFREVDHTLQSDKSVPDTYIDNPWTTQYGAAIWMGLIMAIAGAFGCFADIKPHKSKYMYGTMFLNIIVVLAAILLLIFSHQTITWFDTCQYQYHVFHSHLMQVRDCSEDDKSTGNTMYWTVFVVSLLVIPITIMMLVLLGFSNSSLLEEMCQGTCFRKMVYKSKGPDSQVSYKTKNTHEFNKEMHVNNGGAQKKEQSMNYSQPAIYC